MTDEQPTTHVHVTTQSNSLGIAAFVCSLLGLLGGGVLSPIGLILGIIAVRKEPKGLAMAGIIIGAIGTILLVIMVLIFGTALLAVCGCGALGAVGLAMHAERQDGTEPAAEAIYAHYETVGSLPDETTGNTLISGFSYDGQTMRYEPNNDLTGKSFAILHPGDDGQWDTSDDWSIDWDVDFDFIDEPFVTPDFDDDTPDADDVDGDPAE